MHAVWNTVYDVFVHFLPQKASKIPVIMNFISPLIKLQDLYPSSMASQYILL